MQDIDYRIKQIADHFGFEAQAEKSIEEMAELIAAIKHLNKRDESAADHLVNFVEELADVKIMIDQLIYLYNKDAPEDMKVEKEIERKIERTQQRIQIATSNTAQASVQRDLPMAMRKPKADQ